MSGSEALADRAEKTSRLLSADSESLKPAIAPFREPSAEIVVTVAVWARVIWVWRGAFSAATSFVTRLAISSPDPKPCELNPAIKNSSGFLVEETRHVFDSLRHLQRIL